MFCIPAAKFGAIILPTPNPGAGEVVHAEMNYILMMTALL